MMKKLSYLFIFMCGSLLLLCGCKEKKTFETAVPQAAAELEGEAVSASECDLESYEDFYEYERKTDADGETYVVIKGVKSSCQDAVAENLEKITGSDDHALRIPDKLEGFPVKEIDASAFQTVNLGSYSTSLILPASICSIGEHAFENCGFSNIRFEKAASNPQALTIEREAFAANENLWAVYLNAAELILGEDIFYGCQENMYLCYGNNAISADVLQYAQAYHLSAVEIPSYISREPLVNYPEEPFTLTPEVGSFFYGDSADGDNFCSFESAADAIDFGFPEWHVPCGEFCAAREFKYEVTASSELSSSDDRYAAQNLNAFFSTRETVWAEGVSGPGIGESISITQCCGYGDEWKGDGTVYFLPGDQQPDIYDGYMRFTSICIVNGYAKTQQTFEENGRVKRLLLYVEGKPYACLELEDTINPQYFTLPVNDIKVADGEEIHFKFVIEDVYPGSKYEDTCLTGLVMEFMGRRGH